MEMCCDHQSCGHQTINLWTRRFFFLDAISLFLFFLCFIQKIWIEQKHQKWKGIHLWCSIAQWQFCRFCFCHIYLISVCRMRPAKRRRKQQDCLMSVTKNSDSKKRYLKRLFSCEENSALRVLWTILLSLTHALVWNYVHVLASFPRHLGRASARLFILAVFPVLQFSFGMLNSVWFPNF